MSAVPHPSVDAPRAARPVPTVVLPLVRAAVALALGLVITFSPDHSAAFGLVGFGLFGVATALAQGAAGILERSGLVIAQAALTAVAGAAALVAPDGGAGYFVTIVSGWALVVGAIELVGGVLARRASARAGAGRDGLAGRDAILLGALTVVLGIAFLVVPPDFAQPWQALDRDGVLEAEGVVTASVMTVGLLGAWAILVGVLQTIGALSPRRAA